MTPAVSPADVAELVPDQATLKRLVNEHTRQANALRRLLRFRSKLDDDAARAVRPAAQSTARAG